MEPKLRPQISIGIKWLLSEKKKNYLKSTFSKIDQIFIGITTWKLFLSEKSLIKTGDPGSFK